MKQRLLKSIVIACMIMLFGGTTCLAAEHMIPAGTDKDNATDLAYDVTNVSSLTAQGQVAYFKFTTTGAEGFYNINMKNYSIPTSYNTASKLNIEMFLITDEKVSSFEINHNTSKVYNVKLPINTTYYIKAYVGANEKDRLGNYGITIEFTPDLEGDTKEAAMPLETGVIKYATFDGTGDEDWFSFIAPESRRYRSEERRVGKEC